MLLTIIIGIVPLAFKGAVRELGTWIGKNHHALIYGGSKRGLMWELASNMLIEAGHKIYPNDPCLCGSGKKYKKCCGR